ncbi:hydroxyethylthiazole kinase [Parendozoicomonas haliclonae]|uniref:Hydroxyethylthiazole kinase n=1 Tax=Parendozoicomonas haliclonae TaxID=1960125 RepID=A0A1X7APY6_9GAMM|nr:hydroxyethylthiazole kinase [Parendozoicomonas haliclonae]SMA49434.1 Hydroxyethylthiazole kinase [Parendozoicomonas haliclonae]
MIQTESLKDSLLRLQNTTPLVLNITNAVVMNNTANALLAIGASPLMSDATEETSTLIDIASSLVINIGTLTSRTVMAMKCAASHACQTGRPWVLDPVGAGATRFRLDTSRLLLEYKPTVVRGNAAEIQAIFSSQGANDNTTRGVDSLLATEDVADFAKEAARQHNTVIAITGATDIITDGERLVRIDNGHPMMARVTGTGCTATALTGAYLGVQDDALIAATAGLASLAIAGELASTSARGPGTLQLNILDELYNLKPETLARYLKLT